MKGEVWTKDRIKNDIRIILTEELDALLSRNKIEELVLSCGDDMSTMEFILQKYKYHEKVDDDFDFSFYEKQLREGISKEQVYKVLSSLSVFEYLGYTNDYSPNFKIICEEFIHLDYDIVVSIVDFFLSKDLILKQGDYLRLADFRYYFFSNWLNEQSNANLTKVISAVELSGTAKSFSKAIVNYCDKIHATQFIMQLSGDNGLFNDIEFVNSDTGSKIIYNLVELDNNIEILNAITKALDNYTIEDLKDNFGAGRRYIVWALEKLLFRKESFYRAAKLLFRLAVAENEGIGNNATSQFCQLFQLHLPATVASLADRLSLLRDLLIQATEDDKLVIIQALDRALITGGYTRMGGADRQAGQKFDDYQPEFKEEELGYWEVVIGMLEQLNAYDILVGKFNTQVYNGNTIAMIDAIERMLESKGNIDKDLRQQFEYLITDQRKLLPEVKDRIQSILDNYSENSIREQLEYKVALAPYSTYRNEEGKTINRSQEKLKEFVSELIVSANNDWLAEIDVLLQNEQRLTYAFGREIGSRKEVYEELIDSALEKLAEIPFEQQNNSLIAGYISGLEDVEKKRGVIDRFLANPKIAFHAIQMTRTLAVQFSDLDKLKNLINEFPRYVVSLQYLGINHLTHEEVVDFLEWLKTIEPYGRWVGIDLYYGLVEKLETLESHHIIVVKDLLCNEGILSEENMHNMFAVHEYVELFKKLNHEDLDDSFIKFLAKEIIEASKEVHFNNEYHLKDILEILIKHSWDSTWSVIGSKILEQDYFGWYNMKGLLNKIRTFEDDKLLLWMDKYPKEAPQRVVDFVMFNDRNKEIETWSPLLLEMFNRYYGNEQFLSHLYSELHSFSWSGSLVPTLKKRIVFMEQLLDHEKKEIQEFAKENISYFNNDIKREERRDKNYGLDF